MIEALEKHQNKKCLKCPYHWSDGMYSELFLGTVYTMGKEEKLKCKDFIRSKNEKEV